MRRARRDLVLVPQFRPAADAIGVQAGSPHQFLKADIEPQVVRAAPARPISVSPPVCERIRRAAADAASSGGAAAQAACRLQRPDPGGSWSCPAPSAVRLRPPPRPTCPGTRSRPCRTGRRRILRTTFAAARPRDRLLPRSPGVTCADQPHEALAPAPDIGAGRDQPADGRGHRDVLVQVGQGPDQHRDVHAVPAASASVISSATQVQKNRMTTIDARSRRNAPRSRWRRRRCAEYSAATTSQPAFRSSSIAACRLPATGGRS